MGKYRKRLPQTASRLVVTDAGLETEPVFRDGRELPHFAAFETPATPPTTSSTARTRPTSRARCTRPLLPRLAVVGGGGTDYRHVGSICRVLTVLQTVEN